MAEESSENTEWQKKTIVAALAGVEEADLEAAFSEVVRLVRNDFTSGADSNETGRFAFETYEDGGFFVPLTDEEIAEIDAEARAKDMTPSGMFKQGIAIYRAMLKGECQVVWKLTEKEMLRQ